MSLTDQLDMQEEAGGTRMVLPKRMLPASLARVARSVMILGALMMIAGLSPLLLGSAINFSLMHFLAVMAGALPVGCGLLLARGHSSVLCTGGMLIVREQAGLLRWQRHFELSQVKAMQVSVLPINVGGKAEGARLAGESINILAADMTGKGQRVLLFGYPQATLERVITELRRRGGWVAAAAGPAKVR